MKVKTLALALLLAASSAAHAQIPVTDAASIALSKVSWAKQVADMVTQYKELQRHWEKMDAMEKLQTGTRVLGVNNVGGIGSQVPNDISKIYSGSYGNTASIMDAERMNKAGDTQTQQLEERQFRAAAAERSLALNTYAGAIERLENINTLISKISNAQDPKAIQDLQARISAEEAIIQNEQTKLQMLSQLSSAEEKMIAEKKRQMSNLILDPNNSKMPSIE